MPWTPNILRAFVQRMPNMARTTSTLPSTLEDDIPTCARQCVSDSLTSYFNATTCSTSTTELDCLCSHYSTQGLTLGETAFICLDTADCADAALNATASSKAYDVCGGKTDAVAATHSVLTSFETAAEPTITVSETSSERASSTSGVRSTVTKTSSDTSVASSIRGSSSTMTSSTSSSSRVSVSRTTATFSSTSGEASTFTTSTLSASITASLVSTTSIQPTILSSTTSANATAALASKAGASGLTSSQAVGVSLGTCGGVGILAALIFCCICVRRKKQKKKKDDKEDDKEQEQKKGKRKKDRRSFDFVDKSPAAGASFPTRVFVLRDGHVVPTARSPHRLEADGLEDDGCGLEAPRNGLDVSMRPREAYDSAARVQHRKTQWPLQKNGIIVPAARTNDGDEERDNLPRPHRPPRPDSNVTTFTWFEEDHGKSYPYEIPSLPNSPGVTFSPPLPLPLSRPGLPPRSADHYTRTREEAHQPSLSLEIPPMYPTDSDHIHQHFLPSPTDLTPDSPPMAARAPSHRSSPAPPNSAISYIPSYYTSADSRTPVAHFTPRFSTYYPTSPSPFTPPLPNLPPLSSHIHAPPVRPTPSQPRTSVASSTTDFESLSPNDITPPTDDDDDDASSSKKSAPLLSSPVAGVRYPKVPRASNQSVPRLTVTPKVSRWTGSTAETAFSPGRGVCVVGIGGAEEGKGGW